MDNWLKDVHVGRNRGSQDGWESFAAHRAAVTELLVAAARREASLAVLGAGNCNDLDLQQVCAAFRPVHLVDLDEESLGSGLRRQGMQSDPRIACHGHVDVTGVYESMARWTPGRVADEQILECLQELEQPRERLLAHPIEHIDVATSVCLLSQIVDMAVMALGEGHPRFLPLVQALRFQHLKLLIDLVKPGGTMILVSDFVSSATDPGLSSVAEADLPQHAARLIQSRNFFTGTNPGVMASLLQSNAQLAPRIEHVQVTPPWKWQLLQKVYLVYAIIARRKA